MTDLKWLAEGWAKVAAGTHVWEVFTHGGIWQQSTYGSNGSTSQECHWRTVPAPKKKIDLSKFIGSGIDVEYALEDLENEKRQIGVLASMHDNRFQDVNGSQWPLCMPRMNHWFFVEGLTERPRWLEGFDYDAMYTRLGEPHTKKNLNGSWSFVIAIQITGIKEGWE